jgi:hypothetical protein
VLFPETYAGAASTKRKGAPPHPSRAFIITDFYHTKPQSRKEEEKEIVYFLTFAPLRLCVNHTVTSPEAVTLEPPACRAQLVSGSIYQPKTSVCVARWMLNRVVLCTPSAPA